jgi:hypothetical protein
LRPAFNQALVTREIANEGSAPDRALGALQATLFATTKLYLYKELRKIDIEIK